MKTIKQTYHITAPKDLVWQALVDPKIIEKWTGKKAVMDEKEGSQFSLWDGDIHGSNTLVVKEKELHQDWYGGDWPEPSKVTFTLTPKDGYTDVHLLQENIPDSDAAGIEDGWKIYYLGEIKKLLEKEKFHTY